MRSEKAIVMTAARQIVRRLRSGDATVTGLMKEYHTAYSTVMAAVLSIVPTTEYERIRGRLLSRGGVKTRLKPGHKTWNAGMKGLVNPGCEKGWFKKGHAPYSHKLRPRVHTRIMNDLPAMVRRLRSGSVTVGALMKEYYCSYYILMRCLLTVISMDEYRRIRQGIYLRANNPITPVSMGRHNSLAGNGRHLPQDVRQSLQALRETVSWWECIGCGNDFNGEPLFSCPKCGGLRFAIIRQKKSAI